MKTSVHLFGTLSEKTKDANWTSIKASIKFKSPDDLDKSDPFVQKLFKIRDFKKLNISLLQQVVWHMSEDEFINDFSNVTLVDYYRIARKMNLAFNLGNTK